MMEGKGTVTALLDRGGHEGTAQGSMVTAGTVCTSVMSGHYFLGMRRYIGYHYQLRMEAMGITAWHELAWTGIRSRGSKDTAMVYRQDWKRFNHGRSLLIALNEVSL